MMQFVAGIIGDTMFIVLPNLRADKMKRILLSDWLYLSGQDIPRWSRKQKCSSLAV